MKKILMLVVLMMLVATMVSAADIQLEPYAEARFSHWGQADAGVGSLHMGLATWLDWVGFGIYGGATGIASYYTDWGKYPAGVEYDVEGMMMFGKRKWKDDMPFYGFIFIGHTSGFPVISVYEEMGFPEEWVADVNYWRFEGTYVGIGVTLGNRY